MSDAPYSVWLGETLVGTLAASPDGMVSFRFSQDYREDPLRPVLGQAFEDDLEKVYRGRGPGLLPGFFANLLPEGALRHVLEKSLGDTAASDLSLLAGLGADLPGAVKVRASNISAGGDAVATDQAPEETEEERRGMRFSLAGVQLKFSMLLDGDRLTLPAHGEEGDWIVKLGTPAYPGLAQNELATMEWARACGFDVPECQLHPVGALEGIPRREAPDDSPVLAIRRFDRTKTGRVHQEDFAQVTGRSRPARGNGRYKYNGTHEEIAILASTTIGDEAYEEVVRRIAFVLVSGNHDAHLKNWSLTYPDGRQARLAPLYDQLCTVAWKEHDRELALKLAGTRRPGEVDERRFRHFAERVGMPGDATVAAALEAISRAYDTWSSVMAPRMFDEEHRKRLAEHWERVPILRAVGSLAL